MKLLGFGQSLVFDALVRLAFANVGLLRCVVRPACMFTAGLSISGLTGCWISSTRGVASFTVLEIDSLAPQPIDDSYKTWPR